MEDKKGFYLNLPLSVDLKPDGSILIPANTVDSWYLYNVECQLQRQQTKEGLVLHYYCENDTILNMDQFHDIIKLANS